MNQISAEKIAQQVNVNGPVPLHVQMTDLIELWLVGGEVRPGDRMPAGRVLADAIGVYHDAVVKCYQEMKERGLIEVKNRRTVLRPLSSRERRDRIRAAQERAVQGLLFLRLSGQLNDNTLSTVYQRAQATDRGPYALT